MYQDRRPKLVRRPPRANPFECEGFNIIIRIKDPMMVNFDISAIGTRTININIDSIITKMRQSPKRLTWQQPISCFLVERCHFPPSSPAAPKTKVPRRRLLRTPLWGRFLISCAWVHQETAAMRGGSKFEGQRIMMHLVTRTLQVQSDLHYHLAPMPNVSLYQKQRYQLWKELAEIEITSSIQSPPVHCGIGDIW